MMKKQSHQIIHNLVAAIKPLDQLEEQHIHFVLQWIESGAEIFRLVKPAIPDTHLVCYFVLIMEIECTNPTSAYETHPMIRVFCKKGET